jgi:hypothetical protein
MDYRDFLRSNTFAISSLQGLTQHRVLGTDLGCLFASIRPGAAPGAWHRFGAACLLASDLAPLRVPGTDLGQLVC